MILISGHNNISMIRIENRKNRITLPGRPYLYKLQKTSQSSKEWWTLSCHTKFQELQYWRSQIIKIWSHILTLQRLQLRPLNNFTPLRQSQQDYERINDKEVSILPRTRNLAFSRGFPFYWEWRFRHGGEVWPFWWAFVIFFFAFFDVLSYLFSESFDQPQVSQSEALKHNISVN